jgi:DNA-directed RNA polymerase specialized sigma24 family protein
MTLAPQPQLAAHLQRHARKLFRLACGFGRERDAEDIIQTLYARWWRRMTDEPGWALPESHVELFVCVRRAVMDVVAKEARERARNERSAVSIEYIDSPEEALHAFERLQWILARLPEPLAEALTAALTAGKRADAEVAAELGIPTATFTGRLFKARRAAEELATYYEVLSLEEANLMAILKYGGKSRSAVAGELGLAPEEISARAQRAAMMLEKNRRAAS